MTIFNGPNGPVDVLPLMIDGIAEAAKRASFTFEAMPDAAKVNFADRMTVVATLIRERVSGKPGS